MQAVRRPASRPPRPGGSFEVALARAREVWDGLTGGGAPPGSGGPVYSDQAAAAIVALALGLWSDTAAALDEGARRQAIDAIEALRVRP